jgi:Asp-tRNA(Asn)/Glu-tRNA(Gln) amidotransferase A subunit family amidase
MSEQGNASNSRRKFLQTVPAAVAGVVTTTVWAAQQPGPTAGVVTADTLKAAEALDGVSFSSTEESDALRGINGNLTAYQRLRNMKIPQDVEPAYLFRPLLPGKELKGPATPGAAIRYTRPPATLRRPANLEDAAFWPVTQLAALIERRLVSSVELTRMYLTRLKRYQPALNFYVNLTEDLALKQAADADRAIAARKYKGPLHGIPWGAKDLFATKGIKTTWGGEPYVDQVIDYDATIVERLHDAGAVLVAKLSLGALAQGDRWFGGQTKNPWDVTQGSSGSSAGPGSATAAGCVAFGIGTETRGSILSPASANGCVGLRPTYGRVSRYGAMALSTTMDKVGPLCRYVEDAVIVLNAIYGPDNRDGSVADAAFHWNAPGGALTGSVESALWPLSNYKIAYFRSPFDNPNRGAGAPGTAPAAADAAAAAAGARGGTRAGRGGGGGGGRAAVPLTPEQQAAVAQQQKDVREAYAAGLEAFTKLGAKLVPIDVPVELNQIAGALGLILNVESGASFDAATRSGDINTLATGTSRSSWPNTFREARFVPAVEYIQAMRARTILQHRMDEFMQFDAILSQGDTLSSVTNLTGHPAISVKCAIVGNRPRPIIITGRLYEEATLCRIAFAYEQATEWKDRHPSMKGLA